MEERRKEIIGELRERVLALESENKRLRLQLQSSSRHPEEDRGWLSDEYLDMTLLPAPKRKPHHDVDSIFRKISVIGRGSGGVVYRAQYRSNLQNVCLKLLKHVKLEAMGISSIREIMHLGVYAHPNIIPLLDVVGGKYGQIFLVEELAITDLGMILRDHYTSLSHSHMRTMLLDCFTGLDYLHTCGVAHRDVKPANILYCGGGLTKLCDFGTSTRNMRGVPEPQSPAVTTLWYAAPEMVAEAHCDEYTAQVDVWAMGVILVQLLFNMDECPFSANTPRDLTHKWMLLLGSPSDANHGLPCERTQVYHQSPIIHSLGSSAAHLILALLHYDPNSRATPAQALQDVWLTHQPTPRHLMPKFRAK